MELVDIVYHKLIWDPSPFASWSRLSSGIFWRAAPNRERLGVVKGWWVPSLSFWVSVQMVKGWGESLSCLVAAPNGEGWGVQPVSKGSAGKNAGFMVYPL